MDQVEASARNVGAKCAGVKIRVAAAPPPSPITSSVRVSRAAQRPQRHTIGMFHPAHAAPASRRTLAAFRNSQADPWYSRAKGPIAQRERDQLPMEIVASFSPATTAIAGTSTRASAAAPSPATPDHRRQEGSANRITVPLTPPGSPSLDEGKSVSPTIASPPSSRARRLAASMASSLEIRTIGSAKAVTSEISSKAHWGTRTL